MSLAPLPFIDLQAQRRRIGPAMDEAILKVVHSGAYILGPEVGQLERALEAFCGAKHAITCGNGTDALALVLMAKGVKPGQAIFCPSFTFAATAEVVAWLGAIPVFVDVIPETFNISPASLEVAIDTAKQMGLKPVGIIPVDLFGQPYDVDAIEAIAAAHNLWILSDAAQSFGATWNGRKVGTIGMATSTSFFPAKPLGCYGDGGAIFTDDTDLQKYILSLRVHGQNIDDKYDNIHIGMNGRLDTIQAAVLLHKLAVFPEEIAARDRIARRYNDALRNVAIVPELSAGATSVWAQYVVRLNPGERDALGPILKDKGIPTAIYYPKPLHRQTAYARYPVAGNGLPASDMLAAVVLALPMHPYLPEADQDRIVAGVREGLAQLRG
jgi:dTDP-4-amino-4,6-dideoxygalactose transaminase